VDLLIERFNLAMIMNLFYKKFNSLSLRQVKKFGGFHKSILLRGLYTGEMLFMEVILTKQETMVRMLAEASPIRLRVRRN